MNNVFRNPVNYLKHIMIYVKALGKWLVVSAVVGLVCGLLGSAFHFGVERATLIRETHSWVIYTLPFAGLLAVGIYKLLKAEGLSTNNILSEIQNGNGISPSLLPAIFLTTVLTHLAGGSAGREGAALQMGGSIGFYAGKLFRLDDRDMRTATMIGMAAFFSALFGTPLAAAIFSMGVVSVGLLYHAAFIPCFSASLIAYGVSLLLGISPTRFTISVPKPDVMMFLRVAVLAALCGVLSAIFCSLLHHTESFLHKHIPNPWLRAFTGGAFLLGLTLLLGTHDYNGAGMGVIAAAVEKGETVSTAFLWKMIFTAVTLAVGFKGGEVVPCFFVGAAFGCLAGPALGIPAGFAAAIGLTSVFCGAVNCPIASIFLSAELFGSEGMLYFALACGLSYILSSYNGLYSSQRILYDKLKARFIDVRTNAYHEGDYTGK